MSKSINRYGLLLFFIFSILIETNGLSSPCNKQTFDHNSFVCVCDNDYCDYLDNPEVPALGSYTRIISSKDEHRFTIVNGLVTDQPTGNVTIFIAHSYEYQEIKGFGGAFTDSTGLNVVQLSTEAQDHYIKSYFAPDGIQYSMCRIPIAGSDFSTHAYSYDDVNGDVELVNFALAFEDINYKLPLIAKAIEASSRQILFFGSPWAPPAWMKESGMANGTGGLLREMWDPYSNYLVKFIQEYESHNITIWGMTPQNEPLTGFEENFKWNTCAWSAEDMRDWIKMSLGPALTAAGLRRVQLMVLDHNRDALPWYPATIIEDEDANQYVDGIAVHWYADNSVLPNVLTETQSMFPDKFLLYTESCEGWLIRAVTLGNWDRAQNYAYNIIDDLNNFATGWVDWNMALDMEGGPNWANNNVDSPIIINAAEDEFYKQPMFYAMGHFSKFVNPGARRLYSSVEGSDSSFIRAVAFHNTDDTDVIVVLNTNEVAIQVSIKVHDDQYVDILLNPKSLETVIVNT